MGQAKGICMGFDLAALINPVEELEVLTKPFEKKEMDLLIKHMAPNKSPGPDGFNGLFLKKCWNIISQDSYNLAKDFHHGLVNLESPNSSYITLIPKNNSPAALND
jgi:hypothetical protein